MLLVGADGNFFTVTVLATAPNASGMRTITFRLAAIGTLSMNTPQDADRDNVYRFKIQGSYRGQTHSADYAVTIKKATARATVIEGDAIQQGFGNPLAAIPDVTGDGQAEIGVGVLSGTGGAGGYVIGSEFFNAMPGGRLSISGLANTGAKFSQPAAPPPFANFVSARQAAPGVDLLYSDAMKNKLYLFPGTTGASFNSLRGTPDLDASADAIVYSFPANAPMQEARMIGDVNGDGRNDIMVRSTGSGGAGKFGIIFGRPATSTADRRRDAVFDIELNYTNAPSGAVRSLVEMLSDIDGDGHPDMLISAPNIFQMQNAGSFYATTTGGGLGMVWIIRSSVLRSPGPIAVNMMALTPEQGRYFPSTAVNNVVELADLDGDGYKTLLMSSVNVSFVVDANDLLQAQPGEFGPTARVLQLGNYVADIGDLDGDGNKEVLVSAAGSFVTVVRGSWLKLAIATAQPTPARQTMNTEGVSLSLAEMPSYGITDGRTPLVLGSTAPGGGGLIAFGRWCSNVCGNTVAGSAGHIVLVRIDDIRPWMNGTVTLRLTPN